MTNTATNGYKAGSNLERVLTKGYFAVTGELGPPKSQDAEVIRKKAALLKGVVDAVNLTDNQTAIVRMSSIAAGVLLVREGLEPIIQMTCRDRNRLAMQADLLGACALGIKNVLCLTGDHQSFGNHPFAKNVHDVDSLQLIQIVKGLRDEGKFQCGEEIKGGGPRFFIGAAGIKICIEQIQQVREIEGVAGIHIMAIEWEEAVRPLVEGAGLLPRPVVD